MKKAGRRLFLTVIGKTGRTKTPTVLLRCFGVVLLAAALLLLLLFVAAAPPAAPPPRGNFFLLVCAATGLGDQWEPCLHYTPVQSCRSLKYSSLPYELQPHEFLSIQVGVCGQVVYEKNRETKCVPFVLGARREDQGPLRETCCRIAVGTYGKRKREKFRRAHFGAKDKNKKDICCSIENVLRHTLDINSMLRSHQQFLNYGKNPPFRAKII